MIRALTPGLLLAAFLAAVPAAAHAQGTITHDCSSGAAASYGGGWQTPGATPFSGDSSCGEGETTFLWASYDAYWQWLRLAPDFAEITVQTEVVLLDRDGTQDDAFSLLLHWSGSTDPWACCEPVHATAGLRVLFSMTRNRMEVIQENDGVSSVPLATLPFTLPVDTPRTIRVGYSGTLLNLTVDGVPIGAVPVPATPPSRFGFDARNVSVRFSPFVLTAGCAADADCDGVADGLDNCPTTQSADQTDTDHDGLGNPCDTDDDGDGVQDDADRCPLVSDPLQQDDDFDLVGNACDVCPLDPTNDVDGDRVCGQSDNCPGHRNPGQENQDSDTAGDACDLDDGDIHVEWTDQNTLSWQRDVFYDTINVYRRNLADLRTTGEYVLDPATNPGPLDQRSCNIPDGIAFNEPLDFGETVIYFFSGGMNGVELSLGTDSDGAERFNGYPCEGDIARPFERILYSHDGPQFPTTLLIDNRTDWCAFRPQSCNTPLINFATHVAVVVSDGAKADSCHEIKVTSIHAPPNSSAVTVDYEVIRLQPPHPCACLQVIINPMEVVKTPRPVTSAVFFRIPRTVIPPCP